MNHKLRKKNRWVPILLCCAILLTLTAPFVSNVFGREDKVEITLAGEDIDRFSIQEDEKVTLTADPSGFDPVRYQWQILLDSQAAIWVNIADKTAPDCEVSVALLNAMLDEHNCAYLRCAVTGEENQVYSEPVCALVVPAPEPEQENTAEEQLRAIVEDPLQMRSIENAYNAANAVVLNSGSGDEEDDDDDDDNYVTITVKYLYSSSLNGTEAVAFTPFTATIENGQDFHQDVISPTFLGYAPFFDSNNNHTIEIFTNPETYSDDSAATVALHYTGLTTSQVVSVYYEPIPVRYAIRYFFQNVADDYYTEDADRYFAGTAVTGTTITDTMIESHQGDVTGFTSLYHVPQDVAADGSTIFECYYDRNYYLIQFQLDGGYGVDPIYARYDSTIVVPDPVKPGYRFDGWKLAAVDTDNDTDFTDETEYPRGNDIQTMVNKVPAESRLYRATWTAQTSSYTTVYWLKRNDGSIEYIDSKTTTEVTTGSEVDYADDLSRITICGLEEHEHGDGCYVCKLACYTTETPATMPRPAINFIINGHWDDIKETVRNEGKSIKRGYVYRWRSAINVYHNYFYLGDAADGSGPCYYLGTGTEFANINAPVVAPSKTQYYSESQATPLSNHHTFHDASCLICGKTPHTHNATCYKYPYYEYDEASTIADNVPNGVRKTVAGDGSTMVNVYYRPKQYTLRFYYAAALGGTDSPEDEDTLPDDNFDAVEVIGGSTYRFGSYAVEGTNTDTSDPLSLLDYQFTYNNQEHVGNVADLPILNSDGNSRGYTKGSVASPGNSNRTYFYIEFTAEYGQDITNLWPCSVFEPAERADNPVNNPRTHWPGQYAYVSAWNGEFESWYTKTNSNRDYDKNETIKGKYQILDETLLIHPNYDEKSTISFLCFWENGTGNNDWNVPNLFIYNIWVPTFDYDVVDGAELTVDGYPYFTRELDHIRYKRIQSYDTCDNTYSEKDPSYSNQTQPSLLGYRPLAANNRDGRVLSEDETKAHGVFLNGEPVGGYKEGNEVNFYYERVTNSLLLLNQGTSVYSNNAVLFDQKLSTLFSGASGLYADDTYLYRPAYPAALEPGAYEFKGWYSTEGFFENTFVNLSTATMPAKGIVLYAKWEPKKHTVNYFATFDSMRTFENGVSVAWSDTTTNAATWKKTFSVSHGNNVAAEVEPPSPAGDEVPAADRPHFIGWFFIDENGEKQAMTAQNVPVTRDLNVFAEWHTRKTVKYTIKYVKYNDPSAAVAPETTGEALEGSTRTFTAKAGDELYGNYQGTYFPTLRSHSINMHTGGEEYTFYYVTIEGDAKYTVQYRDKKNLRIPISDSPGSYYEDVIQTASSAVAKERFLGIPNMVPDAFQKKLVLQAEYNGSNWVVLPEHNVITFYYIPNENSAFYAVHFMLEKLGDDVPRTQYKIDGSGGYEESGTYFEGIGTIGTPEKIGPQSIAGFELLPDDPDGNGVKDLPIIRCSNDPPEIASSTMVTVGEEEVKKYLLPIQTNGTELYLFYRRLQYPYHIYHFLYNTVTPMTDPVTGEDCVTNDTAYFGDTVSADSMTFPGYYCVAAMTSEDEEPDLLTPMHREIRIVEEEAGSGSESGSSINLTNQRNVIIFYYTPLQYIAEFIAVPEAGGTLSSTIEVRNGSETFAGSTPTAKTNYDFEGWYLDEDCTVPVTSEEGTVDSTTKTLVPKRTNMTPGERHLFYAKFVKRAGNLTITRSGAETDQVFVYKVQNATTEAVYYVTVTGNGSATIHDLPMGTYYVTQQKDWSWRYDEHDEDVIYKTVLHDDALTTVTFTEAAQTDRWINGNSNVVKNRGGS